MGGNVNVARLLLFSSSFRPEEPSLTSSDQQTISRWFYLECLFFVDYCKLFVCGQKSLQCKWIYARGGPSLAQLCSHLPSESCLGMLHADSLRTLLILDQFPILQIVLVINTWVFMELDLDRCRRAHLGNIPTDIEKRYDWTPLLDNITCNCSLVFILFSQIFS